MNEEELAGILAGHLDALLEGNPLPEPPPAEIAGLLPLARHLAQAAPAPRPEFGPALKESLRRPPAGGNGAAGTGGGILGSHMFIVVALGVLGLAVALALVAGILAVAAIRPTTTEATPATPPPVHTRLPAEEVKEPVRQTPSPRATGLPAGVQATTDSLPTPTPTVLLDVLPPVTVTVEATPLPPPPHLVPGAAPSGGDGDGDRGSSGDHNRGHGNDSGHHDDDNPGRDD